MARAPYPMTRDWKYLAYLGALAVLVAAVLLTKSTQHDWRLSFSHLDKEPYGTYVLNRLLPSAFPDRILKNSYKTIYELKDSIASTDNLLIISSRFNPDREDTNVLLRKIEEGASAFISASHFFGSFADTLGLQTGDSFFQGENTLTMDDSAALHLAFAHADTLAAYPFRRGNIPNYFKKIDSVRATVLARNDFHQPVAVRINKGKGQLILSCTPYMFTNIYMLAGNNQHFVSSLLSYLPEGNVWRTEFYHLGRMETATPLRFILTNEPLRWAYYISIVSLLLFILFEAKRKQRIIPVIKPLANTTLEFVATIGNLYFQRGDHKNIAEKKIQFFFDYVHSHYSLSTTQRDESFILALAKKSGTEKEVVKDLVWHINSILERDSIRAEDLILLNTQLQRFQHKN
jgi:hypothetical protein